MPTGNKGLINHISNMVAPQVSGTNNNNNSAWKIVKTKKQLKDEKKWKDDKSFPPLPVLSSAIDDDHKTDDGSKKSSRSIKLLTTPTKKPSIKLRKVTPEANELKIVQIKTEQNVKDQDDMSTISSSSSEGYFSSYSSDDSVEEEERKAKKTAFRIKCKQDRIKKRKQHDMELDKIIKRIENEHITLQEEPTKKEEIKIKQEQDSDYFEFAYSAKVMTGTDLTNNTLKQVNNEQQDTKTEETVDTIQQELLKSIKNEIDMLHEIEVNKDSVNFYIKEEDTFQGDSIILEEAMDISHIKDKQDYTKHINDKLPRLHDQIIPSSLREISFLGPMLETSISDWSVDGVERGVELERIENSMFFHQLKLHGMDQSFKQLYEELNEIWDQYGVPYNKRKKLLLVEIEMISLLMCDVLPLNYREQGIWVDDISQGQYYQFFKDKLVDSGCKK